MTRRQPFVPSDTGALLPEESVALVAYNKMCGVLDSIQHGSLSYLTQRRTDDEAEATADYRAALQALNDCNDLDEISMLWYAAYEKGQYLIYLITRNALAARRAALVEIEKEKKRARHPFAISSDAAAVEIPAQEEHIDIPVSAMTLSLWQPWASLIFCPNGKRIETRDWKTDYRGPVVIHAARHWTREEQIIALAPFFRPTLEAGGYQPESLPLGSALGIVELVDVQPVEKLRGRLTSYERTFGNYSDGRFGWVLENPRRFPTPIPVQGRQGLYRWTS